MASAVFLPGSTENYTQLGMATFTTNSSYPLSNSFTDTSSNTHARLTLSAVNKECGIGYLFNFNSIPSNATITKIEVNFKGRCDAITNITYAYIEAYVGDTSITPNSTSIRSTTTNNIFHLTFSRVPTRAELNNFSLYIGAQKNSSTARYLMIYGIEVVVTWTEPTTPTDPNGLYVKKNNVWTQVQTVYKKVNGVWVEQTNLSNTFNELSNYIKGN